MTQKYSFTQSIKQFDFFLLILIFLLISTMLCIDIYTPSLPSIQAYFQTNEEKVRITVAMMSLGSCLSIPIYGPLSDAWGRRPVLFLGQIIYLIGLVFTVKATSIDQMIVARFIQGLGSSAAGCVGFALATDLTQGSKRISYFSYLSATITLCFVIGPLIGGVFESYNDWKGSFRLLIWLTVISLGLLFWLPESIKKKKKVEILPSLKAYGQMLKNSNFVLGSLMPPLMISGIVAYIVNGVFYFIHELHMSPNEFSYHQAFVMFVNTLGGILAGIIVRSYGPQTMLKRGMIFLVVGAIGSLSMIFISNPNPAWITGMVSIYAFGLGSCFGIFVNGTVSLFPEMSGSVSSLLSMVRSIVISSSIMLSNALYDQTLGSIVGMIAVATFFVITGTRILHKRHFFSSVKKA